MNLVMKQQQQEANVDAKEKCVDVEDVPGHSPPPPPPPPLPPPRPESSASLQVNQEAGNGVNLPPSLESLPRAEHFPTQRHRWNTNEVSRVSLHQFPFISSSLMAVISCVTKIKKEKKR